MAITLEKTLQGTTYTGLYILPTIQYASETLVAIKIAAYESAGHYTDGFVPIISRYEIITDDTVAQDVHANYLTESAVAAAAIETYLAANVAWYTGGVVG